MFSWHDEHFSVHWFGLAVLAHQITQMNPIRVICVIRWPNDLRSVLQLPCFAGQPTDGLPAQMLRFEFGGD
jgi:hypothetical protein